MGKLAPIQHQRYAHAKQFKCANRVLKKLRTCLGRVIGDIAARSTMTAGSSGVRKAAAAGSSVCASSSNVNAGRRSIPCMPRKPNASARVRTIGLTMV